MIAGHLGGVVLPYHDDVFVEAWGYDGIVVIMATGIVVRKIAPLLSNKWEDPAVVAVDAGLTFAVPLLGGHHGANDLARRLADLGITPVVTTATESLGSPSVEGIASSLGAEVVNRESTKNVNLAMLESDVPVIEVRGPRVIVVDDDVAVLSRRGVVVGVGTRRDVNPDEVFDAIMDALSSVCLDEMAVKVVATAEIKRDERGIEEAVRRLGLKIAYLPDDVINAQDPVSESRAEDLGLVGVAEPCALALSTEKELILSKRVYGRVTVAIAR